MARCVAERRREALKSSDRVMRITYEEPVPGPAPVLGIDLTLSSAEAARLERLAAQPARELGRQFVRECVDLVGDLGLWQ